MSETEASAEASASVPTKPLLFAENPFTDERLGRLEEIEQDWDGTYVPGYSEARRENDIREAKGQKRVSMPKLYWARVTSGDEYIRPNDEGMMGTLRLGFRAMGLDDLESHGFGMPPDAHVDEQGLIRRGDTALFYVDSDRAEKNRDRQRRLNERTDFSEPSDPKNDLYAERVEGENTDRRGSLKDISELDIL